MAVAVRAGSRSNSVADRWSLGWASSPSLSSSSAERSRAITASGSISCSCCSVTPSSTSCSACRRAARQSRVSAHAWTTHEACAKRCQQLLRGARYLSLQERVNLIVWLADLSTGARIAPCKRPQRGLRRGSDRTLIHVSPPLSFLSAPRPTASLLYFPSCLLSTLLASRQVQ